MNKLSVFVIGAAVAALAAPSIALAALVKPQQNETTAVRTTPIGLPQDAGPHDKDAAIEWWYFNAFLTGKTSAKHYALVGAFFRIGLSAANKGHYLIYSLTDLDTNKVVANGSVLDKTNVRLMKSYLPFVAMQHPGDPTVMALLAELQKNDLPAPHRIAGGETTVTNVESKFGIAMDNGHEKFSQQSDDGRRWNVHLTDPAFSVDLTFDQPQGLRPPMLVGGSGMTGLNAAADDMYYLSLTHASVVGDVTVGGKSEPMTGGGWIDRQWGRSWVLGDNGWDWFGVHLDDGSDLIAYRVRANHGGAILRSEATLLGADGKQTVDKNVLFETSGSWTDPASNITFPERYTVTLGTLGYKLTITPQFDEQTIPTVGIGTAFWEGVVNVTGTTANDTPITGHGYRELVGYRAKPVATDKKPQQGETGTVPVL